ncbi:MAG TPA: hypothetical protein VHF89_18485 [Solirubrobacteraceae bacterium]|nr:hypothetical protein [Solirubrobacteraceae bacterium]
MSADDAPETEVPCPPCRATGTVISNLGGTRQRVTCPWCEGTGRLTPGHDAQARWRQPRPEGPPDGPPAGPPDAPAAA